MEQIIREALTDRIDEDEQLPSVSAVEEMNAILSEAERLFGSDIPDGHVNTFYGELNVSWRKGDRILRVVNFSDGRKSLIYYVEMSEEPLPRGKSIRPATAEALVDKLRWLNER